MISIITGWGKYPALAHVPTILAIMDRISSFAYLHHFPMRKTHRFKVVADNGGESTRVILCDAVVHVLEQVVHEV